MFPCSDQLLPCANSQQKGNEYVVGFDFFFPFGFDNLGVGGKWERISGGVGELLNLEQA